MADQAMQSPEDRMMALIPEVEDDAPPPELVEEEEQDAPVEASEEEEGEAQEASDEDSEDQPSEEPRVLTLKHNGEEIQKTEEEVITLAQQGFDYTQKTQALAEERKQVEAYVQAVKAQEQQFQQQVQIQSALMQEMAQVVNLDNQLAQFQQVNWTALSDSDPVEAQKLFFHYSAMQQQRAQVAAQLSQKQYELEQAQLQHREQILQEGRQKLVKEFPDWSKEKGAELATVGKSYGFTDQELGSIVDPRMVKVLADAAAWRKLQSSKPNVTNKVSQAKPVVKPGAKDSKTAANADYAKDRAALKKTGNRAYAARLIERML